MALPRSIDIALDFARLPSLARSVPKTPLPSDILDTIKIAAACPETCAAAEITTGKSATTLIESARFYLQHILFRADADPYRILGLKPGASREQAREHMRWLLQWLHPDRNGAWDAVYAERVLRAWKSVADPQSCVADIAKSGPKTKGFGSRKQASKRRSRNSAISIRLPLIPQLEDYRGAGLAFSTYVKAALLLMLILVGVLIVFALIPSARLPGTSS